MSRPAGELAVVLAGALAEHGITDLTIAPPGGTRTALAARRTDLPGMLTGAAPGTRLHAPRIGLTVERAADGMIVIEAETPAARQIASLLA